MVSMVIYGCSRVFRGVNGYLEVLMGVKVNSVQVEKG